MNSTKYAGSGFYLPVNNTNSVPDHVMCGDSQAILTVDITSPEQPRILDRRIRRRSKSTLGPVYIKRQSQHWDNPAMTLVILFSLKTMESLQNGVAIHFLSE